MIFKKILISVLIISVSSSSLFFVKPKETEAVAGAIACVGGAITGVGIGAGVGAGMVAIGKTVPTFDSVVSSITGVTAANTTNQVSKECILDSLVILAREILIKQITTSIVNWINSGFEGSPAFVTDPKRFLQDTADAAVGEYIFGSSLGFLCEPFAYEVKLALLLEFNNDVYVPRCTLSDVIDNTDNFIDDLDKNFRWDVWAEMTQNPSNNPYGSYVNAKLQISDDVAKALNIEKDKLNWGNGFLSYKKCDGKSVLTAQDYNESDKQAGDFTINEKTGEVCIIKTPGSVINAQLNDTLSTGTTQLELADEINEIIGALLAQLAKQVVGPEGLGGLSSSSYSGGSSYTSKLAKEENSISIQTTKNSLTNRINDLINTEEEYLRLKTSTLNDLNSSQRKYEELNQCYIGKKDQIDAIVLTPFGNPPITEKLLYRVTGQYPNNTVESLSTTTAQTRATNAILDYESDVKVKQDRIKSEIENSQSSLSAMRDVKNQIASATALETLDKAFSNFSALGAHSGIEAGVENYTIGTEMDDLRVKLNEDISVCQGYIYTSVPSGTGGATN